MKRVKRPPAGLAPESRRLWTSIVAEYDLGDSAGLRLLQTACESLDLMRRAEKQVEQDGMTVRDRYGAIRGHPMLSTIRDARAAMLASLRQLNLDLEPLRDSVGRPPGR